MVSKDSLLSLYIERSELANYVSSEIHKLTLFFTTIIIALITIPLALQSYFNEMDTKLLSFFPFIGVVLSISGIIVLRHQRRDFYKILYSLSTIRKTLVKDFKELFKNQSVNLTDDKLVAEEFKKIGITHIDFTDYPTLKCYLKSNVFRWKPFSISIILLLLYVTFIAINFILFYLFIK